MPYYRPQYLEVMQCPRCKHRGRGTRRLNPVRLGYRGGVITDLFVRYCGYEMLSSTYMNNKNGSKCRLFQYIEKGRHEMLGCKNFRVLRVA